MFSGNRIVRWVWNASRVDTMLKSRVGAELPVSARWFYRRGELVTQSVLAIVRRACESVHPGHAKLKRGLQARRRVATHLQQQVHLDDSCARALARRFAPRRRRDSGNTFEIAVTGFGDFACGRFYACQQLTDPPTRQSRLQYASGAKIGGPQGPDSGAAS